MAPAATHAEGTGLGQNVFALQATTIRYPKIVNPVKQTACLAICSGAWNASQAERCLIAYVRSGFTRMKRSLVNNANLSAPNVRESKHALSAEEIGIL